PHTQIYPLSLHDALPISLEKNGALANRERTGGAGFFQKTEGNPARWRRAPEATRTTACVRSARSVSRGAGLRRSRAEGARGVRVDRKSTRLNSSHLVISY